MVEVPSSRFKNRPESEESKYRCGICPYVGEYATQDLPCDKCALAVIADSLKKIAELADPMYGRRPEYE